MDRCVEGFILIDTLLEHGLKLPVVSVAGHRKIEGVTNVVLDQRRAAELTLRTSANWGIAGSPSCGAAAIAPTPMSAGNAL